MGRAPGCTSRAIWGDHRGDVAALIGLMANVAAALMGRQINRTAAVAPTVVTVMSMGIGAVALVLTGLAVEGLPEISWRAALIIGWLAVFNTALAFTLWTYSLRRLSALESSAINNTMLIQIALLAWVFLREPLGAGEIAGIVLVSLGILLVQTRGAVTRSRFRAKPAGFVSARDSPFRPGWW